MSLNTAIIGLGSNISPETNILKARQLLGQKYPIIRESSFVPTKAIGITNQPDFINGAILVQTESDLKTLKHTLTEIENSLGRDRKGPRFGPRTIDLDIIIWNGEIIDQDFFQRDFLRTAVSQLLPDFRY